MKTKWRRSPWKWKNLLCPVCGLWINRERMIQHAATPAHLIAAAERKLRAARMGAA